MSTHQRRHASIQTTPFQNLTHAIRDNDVQRVKDLILHDPLLLNEKAPYFQITALHRSAVQGNLEIIHFLVEDGADIESVNQFGYTPLMLASFHGQLDVCTYLLAQGANALAQSNDTGSTALHWAAERGYLEICRLLLEHGARIDVSDAKKRTPMDVARTFNRNAITQLFQEHKNQQGGAI